MVLFFFYCFSLPLFLTVSFVPEPLLSEFYTGVSTLFCVLFHTHYLVSSPLSPFLSQLFGPFVKAVEQPTPGE